MLRVQLLAAAIAITAFVLPPLSAEAGFERPDILDVQDGTSRPAVGNTDSRSWGWAEAEDDDDGGSASGSFSIFTQNNGVWWQAWSQTPDTVRKTSKKATIDQKRYIWVSASVFGTLQSNYQSGYIEDCKLKGTAQDKNKDGVYDVSFLKVNNNDDTLKVQVKCPKDVLATLGFTPAEQALMDTFLGSNNKQMKINFPQKP